MGEVFCPEFEEGVGVFPLRPGRGRSSRVVVKATPLGASFDSKKDPVSTVISSVESCIVASSSWRSEDCAARTSKRVGLERALGVDCTE